MRDVAWGRDAPRHQLPEGARGGKVPPAASSSHKEGYVYTKPPTAQLQRSGCATDDTRGFSIHVLNPPLPSRVYTGLDPPTYGAQGVQLFKALSDVPRSIPLVRPRMTGCRAFTLGLL